MTASPGDSAGTGRDAGVATISVSEAVARITLNRPEVLNAINADLLDALAVFLAQAEADPQVRVILMTGAGERAFASGADIGAIAQATPAQALALARRTRKVNDAIAACRKPVIAAIRGYCLGAGFELALACDIRIACDDARFGLPETRIGILPGGGGTVRLVKLAGAALARQMVLTGDPITAERAREAGLVVSLHPAAEFNAAADALARRIARLAPFALAQAKSALAMATDADTATALEAEIQAFALCFATDDQKEGARAFMEKRAPRFTGK